MSTFSARRQQMLKMRLEALYEEYEAVSKQIGRSLSDRDVVRLQRQAKQLEEDIAQLEAQLGPEDSAAESGEVEKTAVVSKQALIDGLMKHFDREEIRSLCLRLDVEHDDLPAQGRANKIRELVRLLARRDQLLDLLANAKIMRPHADWPTPQ